MRKMLPQKGNQKDMEQDEVCFKSKTEKRVVEEKKHRSQISSLL